jgi:hypothetical protein
VVEMGGVSFAERQVRIAPGDTPVLQTASGGAGNGLRSVRLRLPRHPSMKRSPSRPRPAASASKRT